MEPHSKNWSSVAGKMEERYGLNYDPKNKKEVHLSLSQLMVRELPNLEKNVVLHALDDTYKQIKVTLDWHRFICIFLSRLPGWWTKLNNAPGYGASTMLLLTDGTVMCQEEGGVKWKKLTPDAFGNYVNGTWSDLAPMHNTRRYYASAVLRNGNVIVSGGEYSDAGSETNKTELYNPVTDTWTVISPPAGWTGVGDSPCAVLPDGRMIMGSYNSTKTAIYDPVTNSWAAGPTKGAASSEESWVLLPDETVITVRCNSSRKADKYVAATNTWVDGGTLPTGIIETSSSEIGAGILLNDGRAFYAGANNHTALYTPPVIASDPGTWTMGPDFPNDSSGRSVGCKDTPSCLMTNGKVLVSAGPVDGSHWLTPTYFFEFNGSSLTRVTDPGNATNFPYIGRMLLLPTGQILFAAQTNEIYVYNYFSCPSSTWRPHITSYPHMVRPFHTYTIHGTNLNGLSQAVGYGDDAAAATNYPLVRIKHLATGKIRYCKTFDHSSMGVATGSAINLTHFIVPWNIEEGPSEICVVANGISSIPCPVSVESWFLHWPIFEEAMVARLIGSLADGPLWVWGPHGPIPVDPWGPKYIKETKVAFDEIIHGIKSLQRLGKEVYAERKKLANNIPLAPDEGSPEDEEENAKEEIKIGKGGVKIVRKKTLAPSMN